MEFSTKNENSMVSHEGSASLVDENIVLSRVNNCVDEGIFGTHAGEITVYYVFGVHYTHVSFAPNIDVCRIQY
jgi:hypothetical protein